MPVKMGQTISLKYQGRLQNGEVFDQSTPGQPLVFTVGEGLVLPGLERLVQGREVGRPFEARLSFAEAFGPYNPDLVFSVPGAEVPANIILRPGLHLHVATDQGELEAVIAKIEEDRVLLDANHPLANQDLFFSLEILEYIKE